MMRHLQLLILFLMCGCNTVQEVQSQSISVHDPVMIKQDSKYYLFCTGNGISVFSSTNLKDWEREKPVFSEAPQWAVDIIPGFRGHIWAPDIFYYNDQYYLYYSVSAFGKNTSAIGVATNKTLDKNSPMFKWVDHGKVIQSIPGKTNWNAIDPNLIVDDEGTPYMSFGSFWGGLQLVKMNSDALSIAESTESMLTIASRKRLLNLPNPPSIDNNPVDAGGNAIEAPFIFRKNGYYYLFASIDYCCKGVNSTYKVIVGRAKNVKGPYLDKSGQSMALGGGSIVLTGNEDWHGIGHNAVVTFDSTDYMICHGYDANDEGRSKLIIRKISWDPNGWPIVQL